MEESLTLFLAFSHNPGEGAFYGPKLEFILRDAIGRDWQCGTLQVDLTLPERMGAVFVDEDGQKKNPVMLHRALFGSLERFIGILIEHYEGKFPFWLSPVQVVVCPITDKFNVYAEEISKKLNTVGFKVEFDHRNQKINYKIREHSHKKVPVLFIVGEKEKNNKSVTIRELSVEKQKVMPFEKAIEYLKKKKFEKKKF